MHDRQYSTSSHDADPAPAAANHDEAGRRSLAANQDTTSFDGWQEVEEREEDHGAELSHLERAAATDGEADADEAAPAKPASADNDATRDEDADDDDDDGDAPVARAAAARNPIPKIDPTDGAHDAPFERNTSKAGNHYAKEDRYNNGNIEDNPYESKFHVDRPGVRVGRKKGKPKSGRDLFTIVAAEATRYTFVHEGGKNVARGFDIVKKSRLTTVNYKFENRPQPAGKTRLLLNPATPRVLDIAGKPTLCVFSWLGGYSAAWIPLDALELPGYTRGQIENAVRAQAAKARPDKAPASIPTAEFVFRPKDAVGHADARDIGPLGAGGSSDRPLKLGPNHGQGGNEVGHYLGKTLSTNYRPADDPATPQNEATQSRSNTLYPVSQNLPQADAAVLAADTAIAGDRFFIPKDKKFVREVSVYKTGSKRKPVNKTKRRQTWVYGFLGKLENGVWVADRSRPGWVPFRVLMPAPAAAATPAPAP